MINKAYLDQLLRSSTLVGPGQSQGARQTELVTSTPNHSHNSLITRLKSDYNLSTIGPAATNVSLNTTMPANSATAKPASPEVYFPFGRPGCGAPLRSDSGKVIADLRQRTRVYTQALELGEIPRMSTQSRGEVGAASLAAMQSRGPASLAATQSRGEKVGAASLAAAQDMGQIVASGEMVSPRGFNRGAGPHVNEYVLREREGKRKKQLEHVVSCVSTL